MKVKLIKLSFGDEAADVDLTVGKVYEGLKPVGKWMQIIDDAGEVNHLYEGEWEAVE